jgi:hypothetical protein
MWRKGYKGGTGGLERRWDGKDEKLDWGRGHVCERGEDERMEEDGQRGTGGERGDGSDVGTGSEGKGRGTRVEKGINYDRTVEIRRGWCKR